MHFLLIVDNALIGLMKKSSNKSLNGIIKRLKEKKAWKYQGKV